MLDAVESIAKGEVPENLLGEEHGGEVLRGLAKAVDVSRPVMAGERRIGKEIWVRNYCHKQPYQGCAQDFYFGGA